MTHPRRIKVSKWYKGSAEGGGYIAEHLIAWEKYHNEELPQGYVIHHLNGIKDDNRPENLVAMKAGEHRHQTGPYKERIKELEDELSRLWSKYKA